MASNTATTGHAQQPVVTTHHASTPVSFPQQSEQKHIMEEQDNDELGVGIDMVPGLQTWRRTLIFVGLCTGLFLSLMDTSIMATAVYTIAFDFNSLANTIWAIVSYQLAYLGFAVVFARLSDFIGRRAAVLLAFTLFVVFSLACGWAQTIEQLIVFRAMQGIGGAGLYALALILLIEISTVKLIAFTSSFIGATIAIAGVLGPVLGGVFTQYATWRWIFWLNGPLGGVAVACFVLGWPNTTSTYLTGRRKWSEFDWPGAVLLLAASVLVVFGIQEGGADIHPWDSGLVISTITVGALCWLLLIAWQYWVFTNRRDAIASMFPFEIITHRPMLAGILSTLLTGFVFFLVVISLPLRFQIVNLKSPASAGVQLLPLLCSCGVGSFVGGALSRKSNQTFPTFCAAGCLLILGTSLLSTLGDSTHIEAKCYGFQVILGFGVGLTFSNISLMTSLESNHRTHAVAQGMVAQVRVFGGAIGVSASNAMFNAVSARTLWDTLTQEQIADLQTNTRVLATLSLQAQNAVRLAYAESFKDSLRLCLYIAVVNLVVLLFTWQRHPPAIRAKTQPTEVAEKTSPTPETHDTSKDAESQ